MLMELKVGKIFMTQLLMFQELQLSCRQQVARSQPLVILKFILLPQMEILLLHKGHQLLTIMFLTWLLEEGVDHLDLHLVVIMEQVVVAVEVLEKEKLHKHRLQEVL